MNMIIVFLFAVLFLPSSSSWAGQYFSCNDMDYFTAEKTCKDAVKEKSSIEQQPGSNQDNTGFTKEQIEIWAEPTVDENGRIVSKLPPLPAMRVLADPSPENVKAYLEWNQKRMEAIERTQKLVQATSGIASQAASLDDIRQIKKIDFYFGPVCPYSIQQAPVIEGLAKKIGYNKARALAASGDPAIRDFIQKTGMKIKIYISPDAFAQSGIDSVPVTIIETVDGRKLRFDGLTENFMGPAGAGAGQPGPPQGQQKCDNNK